MQSTRSQSNSELHAEISGKDLNGKAFPVQEDIKFKKYNTQGAIIRKKLAKKGSKEEKLKKKISRG